MGKIKMQTNGVDHDVLLRKRTPQIEDFFAENPDYNPRKDELLDIRPSHRWFAELSKCVRDESYIFQKIYEEKQQPTTLIEGKPTHVFSSYDYLGLVGHERIEQAAIDAIHQFGTGTGGVRLLTGSNALHDQLEDTICRFKGTESAMVLTSGYLANLTAITGLFDHRDLVVADEYIHRSLIEGIRLANIPCQTFQHNNVEDLEQILLREMNGSRRLLIVVEGLYSMDGDKCPLDQVVHIKEKYNAYLLLDEAHSLGVLGPNGRGADEAFQVNASCIDIYTGSLSKAIPSNGGFIAARKEVIHFLKHGGAPFMFSAALSPPNTAAALASFEVILEEKWRITKLWANTQYLLGELKHLGLNIGNSESPIIPLICGDNKSAFDLSKYLYNRGFLVTSVIYPAVPNNMARLRICCTSEMDLSVIQAFVQHLKHYYHEQNGVLHP